MIPLGRKLSSFFFFGDDNRDFVMDGGSWGVSVVIFMWGQV